MADVTKKSENLLNMRVTKTIENHVTVDVLKNGNEL